MDLNLDEYIIQRPLVYAIKITYQGSDGKGNPLFEVKRNILGTEHDFIDLDRKVFGVMHQKIASVHAHFELYDGSKKSIGKVTKKIMANRYLLKDPDGGQLAEASGDFLGFKYAVTGAGGNEIATISRTGSSPTQSGGLLGTLATGMMATALGAYKIEISDKNFSRLLLLEFTIAVDHMENMQSRPSFGVGGGGFGMGGFGGGIPL